jgi:hypothetical protein
VAIGSAIERGSLICVYDERGTTLFQKAKGSGPKDGLLGFTGSTVTVRARSSRPPCPADARPSTRSPSRVEQCVRSLLQRIQQPVGSVTVSSRRRWVGRRRWIADR